VICEYPAAPKALAREIAANPLLRDADGEIAISDRPGLGVDVDVSAIATYLVDVRIEARGETLFSSPRLL
jgi:L-alanine-DL-glutamate epimerase-like enolase superfamily enzyme